MSAGKPLGIEMVQLDDSNRVIVLDRDLRQAVDYCIHGRVQCIGCQHWCLLGTESLKVVQSGVAPVCNVCASLHITADTPMVGEVEDRKIGDGPH